MYVIVNIGSNLGNRRLNLSKAMAGIINRFGEIEMSHTVETPAHGYESDNKFLNVCIMFQTDLPPHEVLAQLQEIEKGICPASHRDAGGGYADRIIDIDIVAIDDMVMDDDRLHVPHPHLPERRFFLEPLAEIAPGWVHPRTGLSAHDMLIALAANEKDTVS